MVNKLISMNLGVRLVVQDENGQEQEVEWSAVSSFKSSVRPERVLEQLCELFNDEFGTEMFIDSSTFDTVSIAKPVKLKPIKKISHKTFNRRKKMLQELGYEE